RWCRGSGPAPPFVARPPARHDPQQAGLTRAVRADHADLRAGQEVERHVVEHDLVAVRFARLFQDVNELGHGAPYLRDRMWEPSLRSRMAGVGWCRLSGE